MRLLRSVVLAYFTARDRVGEWFESVRDDARHRGFKRREEMGWVYDSYSRRHYPPAPSKGPNRDEFGRRVKKGNPDQAQRTDS